MAYRKKEDGKEVVVGNLEDLWGVLSDFEVRRIKGYWLSKFVRLKENGVYLLALIAVVPILFVAGAVFAHFQLGSDLPWLEVKNSDTAAHWGQIGDFVGGILNPLLSFAALIAVIYSLRAQSKELALARDDARENHRIQAQQSLIFERQNFESVFFRLLDVHARLASDLKITLTEADGIGRQINKAYQGLAAFSKIETKYFPEIYDGMSSNRLNLRFEINSGYMHQNHHGELAHYFRNLYQILKHVDGFGMDTLRMSKPNSRANLRAWIENYVSQRKYANMLRAQLSSSELRVIFLNCISSKGEGLKYYVERFSLLKHMDIELFRNYQDVLDGLYEGLAFSGYEEIDSFKLRAHLSTKR
ncbi:putative phage abortive infection protein [Pseudomonas sichuanensis]